MTERAEISAPALPRPRTRAVLAVRIILIVLAVIGWWISIDLVSITGGAKASSPWIQARCGPQADGISPCLAVLQSKWAYFELGRGMRVPIAALGAGYFAFVALWYVLVGIPSASRRAWHMVILLVVLYGGYVSYQLVTIMANLLGRWCAGCVAAHVTNAAIIVLSFVAIGLRRSAGPNETPVPTLPHAIAALIAGGSVVLLHVLAIVVYVSGAQTARLAEAYRAIVNDPKYVQWRYLEQPMHEFPLREDDVVAGDPAASHTIVVFFDVQCTACRDTHEMLERLLRQRAGEVRIVYRHFPQDPACNNDPRLKTGGHPAACESARALEAARVLGGGEAFRALMQRCFDDQQKLEERPFAAWAERLNLNAARFADLCETEEVRARIAADIAQGRALGISSTPVVFLDGRQVTSWSQIDAWEALLGSKPPESESRDPP